MSLASLYHASSCPISFELFPPKTEAGLKSLYDNVRKLSEEERKLLAKTGYNLKQWQGDTGAEIPWGESQFTLLERIGARPTLEINGIWSGFQGEGVKTIIPETAGAKITMRLVPNQRPDRILRLAIDHLRKIATVEAGMHCRCDLMPAIIHARMWEYDNSAG